MTAYESYADDLDDDYEDDPADYGDDDDPEPDPDDFGYDDYEQARAYAEYYEHCEAKHGGAGCDCRPSRFSLVTARITRAAGEVPWRVRAVRSWLLHQPHFLRIGPVEISVRRRWPCGACEGRGWRYTKGTASPVPRPPGYDGVALCPCGSAAGALADAARRVRKARKEVPF